MLGSVFYPQEALEGFGQALSNVLGVSVAYTTGQPRTDGNTVWLPEITEPLDSEGFAALCGIAVHECAHVYFGSVHYHQQYGQGDPLRASCYNAVLDIADETLIEHFVHSAGRLLRTSNADGLRKILESDALNKTQDKVWAFLAAGILAHRTSGADFQKLRQWMYHGSGDRSTAVKVWQILRKARTRKSANIKRYRTAAQWKLLAKLADDLVALLAKKGGTGQGPNAQGQGQSADGMGFGGVGTNPQGTATSGKPGNGQGKGQTLADRSAGEDIAAGADPATGQIPQGPPQQNPAAQSPPGGRRGGWGRGARREGTFNTGLFYGLLPSLRGPIERIARVDDASGFTGGFLSGNRVSGQIERALLDGRAFDRRNGEGEKLYATVSLDCSGSMGRHLYNVSAVAQSFADALRPATEALNLSIFECKNHEVPNYYSVGPMGGTSTHMAMEWSLGLLAGRDGRKVAVFVTDGEPNSAELTIANMARFRLAGIKVIGIAYGMPAAGLRKTMPGAEVVEAQTPAMLALQLLQIATRIAAGGVA